MSLLLRYISFLCQNDFPHPHFEPTGPFLGPLVHASRVMTFDIFTSWNDSNMEKSKEHGLFFAHFFSLRIVYFRLWEQNHRIWDASARRFEMTFGLIPWYIASGRKIVWLEKIGLKILVGGVVIFFLFSAFPRSWKRLCPCVYVYIYIILIKISSVHISLCSIGGYGLVWHST